MRRELGAVFEAPRQTVWRVFAIEIRYGEVGKRPVGDAMAFDDWLPYVGVAVAAKTDVGIPDGRCGDILPV